MVGIKPFVRVLVLIRACMLCCANAERDGYVNSTSVSEGEYREHYKDFERIVRSLTDSSNEIDEDTYKRSSGGRSFQPGAFQSNDQCDYVEIQRMHTECVCHKPRKHCVRINSPHGTVMSTMPECVIVDRCEGICPYSESCLPKIVESISVPIIVFSLVPTKENPGSLQVLPECKTIQVEKHVKCGCACGISERDCFTKQRFNAALCRCECPKPEMADKCQKQNKSWDPLSCECICPPSIPQTCSTAAVFHKTRCKCVPIESEKAWRKSKRRWSPKSLN